MSIITDDGAIAAFVAGYCEAQRGKPYLWAASGPDAFDCSGLVWAGYKYAHDAGTAYPDPGPRWTTYTLAIMGDSIASGQEQPGDIILPTPGHVGVCVGDGIMINAPTDGIPVREDHYGNPWMIRRLNSPTTNLAIATAAATISMGQGYPKIAKDIAGAPKAILDPVAQALAGITAQVRSILDVFTALGKIAAWLSDPKHWLRLGTLVLGAVVLYLGLRQAVGMVK